MDKNYFIILLVLLVALPTVFGFEYTIETIKNCEGTIKVTDRTEGIEGYKLNNCNKKDYGWDCTCNPLPKPIVVNYSNEEKHKYSFVIEYYVGDNNDPNNKRTYSFEGLNLGGKKEKSLLRLPEIQGGTTILLIIVLSIVGIGIIVGLVYVTKKLMVGKDVELTTAYDEDTGEESMTVDEDVADILDKYG